MVELILCFAAGAMSGAIIMHLVRSPQPIIIQRTGQSSSNGQETFTVSQESQKPKRPDHKAARYYGSAQYRAEMMAAATKGRRPPR